MKTFVQPGDVLTFTVPSGGCVSGTAYLIGAIVAVAAVTAAQGDRAEFKVNGVFDLPKAASQAWAEGAIVYWDNTAKNFTTTSSGNTKAGVAVLSTGSGAGETTGRVRLNATA